MIYFKCTVWYMLVISCTTIPCLPPKYCSKKAQIIWNIGISGNWMAEWGKNQLVGVFWKLPSLEKDNSFGCFMIYITKVAWKGSHIILLYLCSRYKNIQKPLIYVAPGGELTQSFSAKFSPPPKIPFAFHTTLEASDRMIWYCRYFCTITPELQE